MSLSWSKEFSNLHYCHSNDQFNENSKLNVFNSEYSRNGKDGIVLYPYFTDYKNCYDKTNEIKPLIVDFHKDTNFCVKLMDNNPSIQFGILSPAGLIFDQKKNHIDEFMCLDYSKILSRYNVFILVGMENINDTFGISCLEVMSTGGKCIIFDRFPEIKTRKIEKNLEVFQKELYSKIVYNYRKDFEKYQQIQKKQFEQINKLIKS